MVQVNIMRMLTVSTVMAFFSVKVGGPVRTATVRRRLGEASILNGSRSLKKLTY